MMIVLQDNITISLPLNTLVLCFLSTFYPEIFFTVYAPK